MNQDSLSIACCIDESYSQHCAVMLASLFENNNGKKFKVFFLCDNVGECAQRKLEAVVKRYAHSCQFIAIDNAMFREFPVSRHIAPVVYAKLMLGEIIPENNEKLLYLDSDIIVRKNIENLWEIDVTEYLHASIENLSLTSNKSYKALLEMPPSSKYFNAGVMLINLKDWRKEHVFEKAMKYVADYREKITWWDQDALNVVSCGHWLALPPRWNVQQHVFNRHGHQKLGLSYDEYQELLHDPAIVHFTGGGTNKPWHFHCQHPFKNDYWTYIKNTDWKMMKPVGQPSGLNRLKAFLARSIAKCR